MSQRRSSADLAPGSAEIVQWRRRQLLAAGFEDGRAAELARSPETDLHAMLDLIDHGCPPDLAARILAPLDTFSERRCSR